MKPVFGLPLVIAVKALPLILSTTGLVLARPHGVLALLAQPAASDLAPEARGREAWDLLARDPLARKCVARDPLARECVARVPLARECVARVPLARERDARESVARECDARECRDCSPRSPSAFTPISSLSFSSPLLLLHF